MSDAIHLPGGNRFDNMRIDLRQAYAEQDEALSGRQRQSVRRSAAFNYMRLAMYVALRRAHLHEMLVANGVIRNWFDAFSSYWSDVLGGRPITVMDCHALRFHYRMKAQSLAELSWGDAEAHVSNWQDPNGLTFVQQLLYRQALNPVRYRGLWRLLRPGMRALEYGCALAPMYATWRAFLNHRPVQWMLADIPNFPFHYARHVYGGDAEAELVTVSAERLSDPLAGRSDAFDIVFLQEVFEHLHDPLHIAGYLLDRIVPGGLFVFDYIRSDATGLDTPAGLEKRGATLDLLANRLEIVDGQFHRDGRSVGLCIGRKKK